MENEREVRKRDEGANEKSKEKRVTLKKDVVDKQRIM